MMSLATRYNYEFVISELATFQIRYSLSRYSLHFYIISKKKKKRKRLKE